MSAPCVLIVHQDGVEADRLARSLPRDVGGEIVTSISAAFEALRAAPHDAVVLAMHGEGARRFDDLERLRREHPAIPVILVAASGGVEEAVEAIKRGGFHYLAEPFEDHALRGAVEDAVGAGASATEQRKGPRSSGQEPFDLVGSSPAMRTLRETIALVAASSAPVLVTGESGSGKELVARAIHARSPRRAQPFVAVNTSAIPEELLEAEVFGHVRGGFTGAAQSRKGLLTEASGGTLLLDEIGDMQIGLQAKVLRVLQFGEVRPVGSDRSHHVDVRIVAATHRDLPSLMREGRFRDDLFFRLNVLPIVVPPLRERREDIPELVAHLLAQARARCPGSPVQSIEPSAMEILCHAPWPGNVRELAGVIERLVVMGRKERVDADQLDFLASSTAAMPFLLAPSGRVAEEPWTLRRVMLAYADQVLVQTGGDKQRAAEILDVDLSTIYRWQRTRSHKEGRLAPRRGHDSRDAAPPSTPDPSWAA